MSTGSFIWYELMAKDADAAAKFYGAVVGWRFSPPRPCRMARTIAQSYAAMAVRLAEC